MSNSLTARVSATLRKAGLPVLRYSDRIDARSRSGIRVGNYSASAQKCCVFFSVYVDDESSVRDEELERELSDQSMAVLVAAGFDVDRSPGINLLDVRYQVRGLGAVEDVSAVVDSSGLDITQPTRTEWHVAVDGKRYAYVIRRTGNGDRTRFAVHGSGFAPLARNLRTMGAAIEVVKQELRENS